MTRPLRIAHVATIDLTVRFLLLPQLKRLRDEGYEVTAISAPGPWVEEIESEGIRHVPWRRITRAWSPWSDVLAFRELVRILRNGKFDLVHTHNPKPGIMGRVAARAAGVPCVVNTVHGFYATPDDRFRKRAPVMALERLAARFSDVELYQSNEDLVWAGERRVGSDAKRMLLGNGTDLQRFDPGAVTADGLRGLRTELGIPEGVPVVGTIGRLVREKGYEDLLEAADLVRAVVPDVRLLLVGARGEEERDGFSRDEIAARKAWMVLTEWRTDIPALLALMDVFVLASWREGMPRSAIEAAAMARPLVLTDIRGCREVARNDVEGFLVPPRSPSKLAAVIALLLQDGGLRARMGEAARTRALESFDEKRVGDRVEDVYRQLLWKKGLRAVGGDPELRIRRARARDAAALARLHLETLPTAFLPKLGLGFLTVLYRALSRDAKAVVFVAENDGVVVGFAAAVPSVRLFYRSFYRRHGVRAGLAALPRLIRPRIVRHILQTARYPRVAGLLPDAELLSIAVAPSSQAKGVGRGLAEAVRRGLADQACSEVKVVVGAENTQANVFYERMGFRRLTEIAVHADTRSNVWVASCPS